MSTHAPETMQGGGEAGGALGAISKRTFARGVMSAVVLLAGVVVVRGLEAALHATFDKPPAPLSKPLTELPRDLGSPVRYRCKDPDLVLEPEIVEALGTNDYLMREYRDVTRKETDPGAFVSLNLNYYATGSSTPHVPEVCWAGNGRVEADNSRVFFDVKDVPRRDGTTMDLRVRMISFVPDPRDLALMHLPPDAQLNGEPLYTNVAYVFQVNGEYVANPQEVMSRFWKASNRYAYHAKIEVTPMIHVAAPGANETGSLSRPLIGTRAEAERIVSDYLRASVAEIEKCLPDPSILSASSPSQDSSVKR